MLLDDLTESQARLIQYVVDACNALEWLRAVHPETTIDPGPAHEQWVIHMNNLNNARVWLAMAAEYMHDELNTHNEAVIFRAKRRTRKRIHRAELATELANAGVLMEDEDTLDERSALLQLRRAVRETADGAILTLTPLGIEAFVDLRALQGRLDARLDKIDEIEGAVTDEEA